jgi:hypothetical protein
MTKSRDPIGDREQVARRPGFRQHPLGSFSTEEPKREAQEDDPSILAAVTVDTSAEKLYRAT